MNWDWEQRDEDAPEWLQWVWVALIPITIGLWVLLWFWPEGDEPMKCAPEPPALTCAPARP